MCDILTVSSSYTYKAPYSLNDFAICGNRNRDGWGIGYFDEKGQAVIQKSRRIAYDPDKDMVDDELIKLSKSIRSKYIVGHVRLTSCGATCDHNCHPFKLNFLGRDWLFAHNGTCRRIMDYKTENEILSGVTNDSARIFEYLRDRILQKHRGGFIETSFFQVLSESVLDLINEYDSEKSGDDNFNFVLCEQNLMFVFMHHRPFFVLHRPKSISDALIITTCEDGLTDGEIWVKVNDYDRAYGTLLLIVDDLVVHREEIYRGT